ncbi:MAG: alanine dehydrogenase [Pseudomonadota bacterium]
MKIGIVKEITDKENRVALPPAGVGRLVDHGHPVLVQETAGLGSGFSDQDYLDVGAEMSDVAATWAADIVIKVKEPLKSEYGYLRRQILFTYLHLAGVARGLTEALVDNKTTAVAYETVEDEAGKLPLLAPMSAVAGNMATLVGSYYLASFNAGKGVQLGTVLGRKHGNVVIIGDGVVGKHAANVAAGMGANVLIFGKRPERSAQLKQEISNDIDFVLYEPERVAEQLKTADLVVGAVLRHGARAPHVVTTEMIKRMEPGSVIVDVSIDQGGCFETSRPTSHSDPIYVEHGVTHYCVTNMPGAFPKTSTIALSEAILPYALKLADQGIEALLSDSGFAKGLNTHQGFITYKPVAEALDMLPVFRKFAELI